RPNNVCWLAFRAPLALSENALTAICGCAPEAGCPRRLTRKAWPMHCILSSGALTMTESTTLPPVARREPTPTLLHGQTLEDDYRWMRDKGSDEVTAYLEAENAYTAAAMKPTEEL